MRKIAIFDFDGCLVDSKDELREAYAYAIKKAIQENLLPENTDIDRINTLQEGDKIFNFIGGPVQFHFKKLFPNENQNTILKLASYFNEGQWKSHAYDRVYPDVKETLQKLKKDNFEFIIITARIDYGIKKAIKLFEQDKAFGNINFIETEGMANENEEKHLTFERIINRQKINLKKDLVFAFGDKNSDTYAANKAAQNLNGKIHTVLTAYGYETKGPESRTGLNKPEFIVQSFSEISQTIKHA